MKKKRERKRRMRQSLAVLLAVFMVMPGLHVSAGEEGVQERLAELVAEDAAGEKLAETEVLEETAGGEIESE